MNNHRIKMKDKPERREKFSKTGSLSISKAHREFIVL
jgi:hypothetical protein